MTYYFTWFFGIMWDSFSLRRSLHNSNMQSKGDLTHNKVDKPIPDKTISSHPVAFYATLNEAQECLFLFCCCCAAERLMSFISFIVLHYVFVRGDSGKPSESVKSISFGDNAVNGFMSNIHKHKKSHCHEVPRPRRRASAKPFTTTTMNVFLNTKQQLPDERAALDLYNGVSA